MNASREPHRKRVRTFNVPGHAHFLTFSCYRRIPLLTNDTWRTWLAQAVKTACAEHDMALWAYVFMPEHVHLLVKPRRTVYEVSAFRKQLKQSASKRILNALKKRNAAILKRLVVQERPGKACFRFWQEGPGHDKNIWSLEKAWEKAVYCHLNPVKRKLVKFAGLWRWSSFRWLELGKRDGEPLTVNAWDERLRDDPDSPALDAYSRSQWHQFFERTARP
ncbi:MAG: transposase [Planctomycetes bacterium]|nr:transposase [Planctomycetota bacterium]